jgi:hypothetical protein
LKPSHGLEVREWQERLKAKDFASLQVIIRDGTFLRLVVASDNKNYLRANSTRVNWDVSYDVPETGDAFTLGELIKTIPDLEKDYISWKSVSPAKACLEALKTIETDGDIEVRLRGNVAKDTILDLFPKTASSELTIEKREGSTIVRIPSSQMPFAVQKWSGPFDIGDAHLVAPIQSNLFLNDLSRYFATSYILGMLARYYPGKWISLGRGERGDSFYPMARIAVDFIESKFPQIVLDFLESPYEFEKQ